MPQEGSAVTETPMAANAAPQHRKAGSSALRCSRSRGRVARTFAHALCIFFYLAQPRERPTAFFQPSSLTCRSSSDRADRKVWLIFQLALISSWSFQ